MTTPRTLVKDALTPLLGASCDLMEYARQVPPPPRPVVMIRADEVTPNVAGLDEARRWKFALVVLASLTDPTGPADDQLDTLLEDVLHAVDQAPGLTWESAKRAVYADTTPAYEVTVIVHTLHTDTP